VYIIIIMGFILSIEILVSLIHFFTASMSIRRVDSVIFVNSREKIKKR